MTLQQVSEIVELALPETLSRFGGNEQLFLRFFKTFPSDPTWKQLCDAMQQKDYHNIEISAHTLKGVSANLGLTHFSHVCNEVVSAVRQQQYDSLDDLMQQATLCYDNICRGISLLDMPQ